MNVTPLIVILLSLSEFLGKEMPRTCAAPGCKSNYKGSTGYKRVFNFPSLKRLRIRNAWVKNLRRADPEFEITRNVGVCEEHFAPEDFVLESVYLRKGSEKI